MHRRQNMGKPRNRLGLAATSGMLNQVVAGRMIENDIIHNLLHSTELVESREYQLFCAANLACVGVFSFLRFDIYEPLNEEGDLILRPDIFPHIGNIDAGLTVMRIPFAKLIAYVEGIEEGILANQFGAEIDLIQIHSECRKHTDLFFEETSGAVALILILLDCILVVLPGSIALQFYGKNGDTVQKQHKVNALIALVVYLLDRKSVV